MKSTSVFPALAALLLISSLSVATAQPGGYGGGPYRQQQPDYNRQQSMPNAPVIIIDANGRRSNSQYGNFTNYNGQQSLSRKQRKRLEKRYGYVPPLAIYVPERFVNRSGMYVYNNNIAYYKDRDGLFHLDARYFNDNWDDYDSRNDSYNRDDRYNRNDRDNRSGRHWDNNYPSQY